MKQYQQNSNRGHCRAKYDNKMQEWTLQSCEIYASSLPLCFADTIIALQHTWLAQ